MQSRNFAMTLAHASPEQEAVDKTRRKSGVGPRTSVRELSWEMRRWIAEQELRALDKLRGIKRADYSFVVPTRI